MARLLKILLVLLAGFAGVLVLAAVAAFLFFDPNDFKDRLSAAVKEQTGRELVISGDISLTYFPWLAVQVGHTELGNAEGFSAEQMLSFDAASLSVRIVPLIFSQELEVGTAALDGLVVNLEVDSRGRTNWDDLASGGDTADEPTESPSGDATGFDVASVSMTGASVSYSDAQAGSSYAISNLSFETGRIAAGVPIAMNGEFDFSSTPGELGGHIAIRGTMAMSEGAAQISVEGLNVNGTLEGVTEAPADFNFDSRAVNIDTAAQSMDLGEMDLVVLGMSMSADVDPFSYAGSPQPTARLAVSEFSLKELMQKLDIEPPVTADPDAMQRVSFSATAKVGDTALSLTDMLLELDDSTMTGSLSLPTTSSGAIRFDLGVDQIALDGYMAPADEDAAAAGEEAGDVEIPVDLIRTLNVNGSFKIARAYMTGMEFENLELGVVGSGGKLRLNPLAADFYDGGYSGDVRIDASGDVPSVSANERISNVNLGAMAKAMFDVENISGTINGSFVLGGSGRNLSAIRQDLDGNMSFELLDGAWEGTDIWHQLRTARALFRQEAPPKASGTPRTEFSNVSATGTVTDGIFQNNDFIAELPFLQLTGGGMVDLNTTGVDYQMQVRVLDRPEFMAGATQAEIDDFTETVVPLKITGTLASPSVRPDMEGIFRARVEEAIEEKKEELKDQLLQRLLGTEESAVEEGEPGEVGEVPPAEGEQVPEEETEEEVDLEEELKKKLLNRIFEN
jgi:AsmA protein